MIYKAVRILTISLAIIILSSLLAFGAQKQNYKIAFKNGMEIDMVWVPGSTFMMGRTKNDEVWLKNNPSKEPIQTEGENPRHLVAIDGFWMGKYEITTKQFCQFLNEVGNPKSKKYDEVFSTHIYKYFNEESKYATIIRKTTKTGKKKTKSYFTPKDGCENRPANEVNWYGANAFCEWLSKKTGKNYRLPTEAEWEFACRAGSETVFYFGNNSDKIGEYAWYNNNSKKLIQPVGKKLPNKLGLYDMMGNAEEWCLDYYDTEFYSKSLSGNPCRNTPPGKENDTWNASVKLEHRVIRGGSYLHSPHFLRSAKRDSEHAKCLSLPDNGFRIVRVPGNAPKKK